MAKSSAAENSAAEGSREFRGGRQSNFCLNYHCIACIVFDSKVL